MKRFVAKCFISNETVCFQVFSIPKSHEPVHGLYHMLEKRANRGSFFEPFPQNRKLFFVLEYVFWVEEHDIPPLAPNDYNTFSASKHVQK